jgi:hypothetical protein
MIIAIIEDIWNSMCATFYRRYDKERKMQRRKKSQEQKIRG